MIDLIDVSFEYENGTRALSHVDLKINSGEFAFVVGASGAGKSSLLKLLTRETVTTSGKVFVNGFDLNRIKKKHIPKFRRSLGMIFQDFRLIPTMNVFDNVAFGLRVTDHSAKYIRNRVPYVLDLVGLLNKGNQRPDELSGGEQQRVAIARALVNNPQMIIADEPTGNLDPMRSLEIMMLLERINELGTTVLVVTHERELVDRFSKRVVAIENGRIISDETGGYYNNETTI